jgi:hypothetical protein
MAELVEFRSRDRQVSHHKEGLHMIRISLIAALGLVACLPTASATAASSHYYRYIGKVQISGDGYLYINCAGNCINDDRCPETGAGVLGPWYAVSKHPLSDDITRAQLQVALASFLSRQKVFVTTTGCRDDGRLLLDTIQIEE